MSGLPAEAIPFPYLAGVVRDSSMEDAINMFKAVTQLTFHTRHFKMLEKVEPRFPYLDRLKSRLKQSYSMSESAIPLRGVSLLDSEQIFEFVYEHADRVDESPDTLRNVDIIKRMTLTEQWLVHCVLHPEIEKDDWFESRWSEYIQSCFLRDTVDSAESYYAKRMDRADVEGASTGLHHALQTYVTRWNYDAHGVYHMLIEYMSLGATAAKVWELLWRGDGIMRGTPVDVKGHIAEALASIEEYYARRIGDEGDTLPFYVRQHFAHMNISGEFLVLLNWVFPSAIAPAGSTIREDEFAAAYQRWIIDAATAPEVDPDGRVAEMIRTAGMAPGSYPLPTFNTPMSIIQYESSADDELEGGELMDMELVPYGERNKTEDFTNQVACPPSGSVCAVCREEFESDVDESPCRQLVACKHIFHLECLDGWINASHFEEVRCPNCRQAIYDAQPRRLEPILEP
jgi:hypothetical protein